jgi:hypothetical protein
MTELIEWVMREKSVAGPLGNDAIKAALATLWFVGDYAVTYLYS